MAFLTVNVVGACYVHKVHYMFVSLFLNVNIQQCDELYLNIMFIYGVFSNIKFICCTVNFVRKIESLFTAEQK